MADDSSSSLEEKGYRKGRQIGQGTYGIVYLGHQISTGREVAMKRMRMGGERSEPGIDVATIRELKILRELHSEYVVELVDVFVHFRSTGPNFWIIYEMMATDLEHVINDRSIPLSAGDVKSYFYRILKGLEYLHANYIVHRDIKPGNLLISARGELKFGDFGLAKAFGREDVRMSPQAITRWYRPPEMLFGADMYGSAVDIWSAACVFAELQLRVPYFFGDSDMEMLAKIVAALGTPKEEDWPGVSKLKDYIPFEETRGTPFETTFSGSTVEAIDLLKRLLKYDPNKRDTAKKALEHKYFSTGPAMTPCEQLRLPVKAAAKPLDDLNVHGRNVRPRLEEEHGKVKKELNFDIKEEEEDKMDFENIV